MMPSSGSMEGSSFRTSTIRISRVAEIYRVIPAMKELDDAISTTAVEAARKMLGGDQGGLLWRGTGAIGRSAGAERASS